MKAEMIHEGSIVNIEGGDITLTGYDDNTVFGTERIYDMDGNIVQETEERYTLEELQKLAWELDGERRKYTWGEHYVIDYCNGVTHDYYGDLSGAMDFADEAPNYTQCDIKVLDKYDMVVASRRWWGVAYKGDDTDYCENPIVFGDYGYYADWDIR